MALLYHLEFFQYVHGFCQRFESACWVANLIFHRDILSRFQEISWVSDLLECERLFKGGDCVSFLSILQMHSTTGVHNGSSKIPVEQKIIWCSKTLGEEVKINHSGTYMVVQWLIICLPMQKTQVQSLVQENPTCWGATKPVFHNCWAREP